MALDTKLNLNNNSVEQISGDTLNLSGQTNIYGTITSVSGYEIAGSGTTIYKDESDNLVFKDTNNLPQTLTKLVGGANRIISNSGDSFVSFENSGSDKFVTIQSSDENYIVKLINNSGDTVGNITRDGDINLTGDTTNSKSILIKNINLSGSTELRLNGVEAETLNLVIASSSDVKDSYPTGYSDIGQIFENIVNPVTNTYPHLVTDFNVFLLSASGNTRCEVFDGTGYTGTLLGTKDIIIPDNNGADYNFTFDTPIIITPDQLITFKITKISGATTFGGGVSTGSTYTYPTIFDGALGAEYIDFYISGVTYSGNTTPEALLMIKRVGEYDITEVSKYRGKSRIATDTELFLGGGNGITFQTNGLISSGSSMTDVLQIDNSGKMTSLVSGYTELITNDNDFITRGYLNTRFLNISREIMFYEVQEVIFQHISGESVNSANLSKWILEIEYSDDDGSSWYDPSYPIIFSAGTESFWRVKTYSGSSDSGNVIINSLII